MYPLSLDSILCCYHTSKMPGEKKQFNVYLSDGLIKRVKHAAIESEQRLSDFVADALEAYLEGGGKQK